ncbi:TonB-dependent receptor [Sphingobacterium sp. Mn56C]|uniref:TonB-dependent receptor n=1 Tax=Sphingobacterium sp. Mn56C TaxID=3395261 RepID=UPI003BC204AA
MNSKLFYLLAAVVPLTVQAQDKNTQDTIKNERIDEVYISSSRGSEKLSQIPTSVTVVNSKQLRTWARVSSNMSQILEATVSGLGPATGTYSNSGQLLRGRNMLVMIDGVPQSTPIRDGGVDLKTVLSNDLKAIEVIKGATSLYGVGGSGGFVNYITRDPEGAKPLSGNTQLWGTSNLAKSNDSFGAGIYQSFTGSTGRLSYYASGSYEKTGNTYDAKGVPIFPTYSLGNTKIYSAFGKVGYKINADQSLKLRYNFYKTAQDSKFIAINREITVFNGDGDYELIPGYGVPGKPDGVPPGMASHNAQLTYSWDRLFNNSTAFTADVFFQNVDNIFFYSPNFENGGQSRVLSQKYGARPNFNSKLFVNAKNDLSLTYGLDFLHDKTSQPLTDGRIWMPEINLSNWAPYAMAKWAYDQNWVVKVGGRYDFMRLSLNDYNTLPYSAQGNGQFSESVAVHGGALNFKNASFNVGVRYNKHNEFVPYLSYSQGFSLPDVGLAFRNAAVKDIQDIAIKPVVTNNYEFGFVSTFKHVRLEAVGYYSTSKLGTAMVFVEATKRFELSQSPQSIFGADVTLDFNFLSNKLNFGGTYTYTEGMQHTATNPYVWTYIGGHLISPPKTTFYVHVEPIEKLSFDIQAIFVGNRKRFAPIQNAQTKAWSYRYQESPVKRYNTINLQANYKFTQKLDVSLAVNNIFNTYYMPARSQWMAFLPTQSPAGEGANARLSLNYSF